MEMCRRATPRDTWARSSWEPPWARSCAAVRAITIRRTFITATTIHTLRPTAITPTILTPEPTVMEVRPMDPTAALTGERRITPTPEPMREGPALPTLMAIERPDRLTTLTPAPTEQRVRAAMPMDRGDSR